jgi:SAM-dependent methyltransferase
LSRLTNKSVYEAKTPNGAIYGTIGPNDWNRFKQTLRFVPDKIESVLDAGCDRGHWLNYLLENRSIARHLGIDISEERIAEARGRYPGLDLTVGYLELLPKDVGQFDLVTCMEVLEHIPEWEKVLGTLLTLARRRVLITVPYREDITNTVCVHCGKLTPLYGHFHTFTERSFPDCVGWSMTTGFILDYRIGSTFARRLYRMLHPRKNWLVVAYDRI